MSKADTDLPEPKAPKEGESVMGEQTSGGFPKDFPKSKEEAIRLLEKHGPMLERVEEYLGFKLR